MSDAQYAIALYQVAKDLSGKDLESVLSRFVQLLADNHKLKSADKIIYEFINYAKKQERIMDIEITSARVLSKEIIEKIKKVFGDQTESKERINKNLLGGLMIKTDEIIFDVSLKTQLNRLKQIMS